MDSSPLMHLSHQMLADHEVPYCLRASLSPYSQRKMDASNIPGTELHAETDLATLFSLQPPKSANLGEDHRCKLFPCPVCHPGRDNQFYTLVELQKLQVKAGGKVQQQHRGLGRHELAGVVMFGDGGHTCRKFPCPVCGNGRSQNVISVEVGY